MDAETGPERPAHDGGVLQPGVLAQDRLHVLRVDLLAVREREHVLLPASEREHAVGRDRPQVARVIPAVGIDRGRRRLGVLPVAEEAARTAGQDLPVVGDPHLDAGDRLAHRSEDVPLRSREGDDRTHLGWPRSPAGRRCPCRSSAGRRRPRGPMPRRRWCAGVRRTPPGPAGRAVAGSAWGRGRATRGAARTMPFARTGRPAARSRRRAAAGPGARSAASRRRSRGRSGSGPPAGG